MGDVVEFRPRVGPAAAEPTTGRRHLEAARAHLRSALAELQSAFREGTHLERIEAMAGMGVTQALANLEAERKRLELGEGWSDD